MRVKKTYIKEEHKMSTNHTPIYNLCHWEPEDPVLRTDFNEDNAKIEIAMSRLSERASALEGRTSNLEGGAYTILNPQVCFGAYTGSGTEKKTITLGFRPKLVLALRSTFQTGTGTYFYSGMALDGSLATSGVRIVSNGFEVFNCTDGDIYFRTNEYGHTYMYLVVK